MIRNERKNNFSINQAGSAIFLAMILIGVIAGAVVYLTNLSTETTKKVTGDSRVLSYRSLVQIVQNKIHFGKTCTKLLGGRDITYAFVREGQSIDLDLKLDINKSILNRQTDSNYANKNIADKWFIKGGTSIKDVRLTVSEMVRSPVISSTSPTPENLIAAKGFIRIIPDHFGTGAGNSANKVFRIPIFLYYKIVGTSRVIHSCYPPEGEAYTCTKSLFGYFNQSSTDPRLRCQPQRFCFHNSQTIINSPSCSSPYTPFLVGDGKYSCEWCNPNTVSDNCFTKTSGRFFKEPFDPKIYNSNTEPYRDFNSLDYLTNTGFPAGCGSPSAGGGTTGSSAGQGSGGFKITL